MCGIVGIVSKNFFNSKDIMTLLKRLEYRGYDSFGYADPNGNEKKIIGNIDPLKVKDFKTKTAICHTRWATHGRVNEANAHPQTDCKKNIFVVHNGIIENYLDIKNKLIEKGHSFVSDTDTEIISHFIENAISENKSMEEALQDFISVAEGTFAFLVIRKGIDKIYAAKRDSPLVLGIMKDGIIIGSDIYAFSNKTNDAIWIDNNEYLVLDKEGFEIFNSDGVKIEKQIKKFKWEDELQNNQKKYEHHMIKEIHEIPTVANRLLLSLDQEQEKTLAELVSAAKNASKVLFVAAGTSYHTSLLGAYFLNRAGIDTRTMIASEFKNYTFLDDKTLVIAISQSGETMDVIEALKTAKKHHAKITSIVNSPYSTIQRMSEISLNILAGQEICVAATKTFVNQVIVLLALSSELGWKTHYKKISQELENVFTHEDKIKDMALSLTNKKDIYIIGRGMAYPISREIALKLKEISYKHAEGMMGGELKHGTLALIEEGTSVIGLVDNKEIISNLKEVEARGGSISVISDTETEFPGFLLNTSDEASFALCATMVGQLLTYYIAKNNSLPIDKPRNLAKCCTVK
ncbi:glutamine--fructose-6-phosphate transaminase (isomerizing) [Candidatus Aenigmatarchaeota archaeon]